MIQINEVGFKFVITTEELRRDQINQCIQIVEGVEIIPELYTPRHRDIPLYTPRHRDIPLYTPRHRDIPSVPAKPFLLSWEKRA